ncbi:MAG: 16S rRNA (adenine(1518)-N(6)/adenine(1519)-N(6))-dimethyltransferase RsmA [Alphaproteobacteria bacterium]|nr:16S rRNA (adenine(1518)-N(6)/adenine(1519)-N(6))-dimethyltransferase RsmA [Alphaproteobacteria bacterium]
MAEAPTSPAPPRLPTLGETVRRHALTARKSLGQHFLFDENLTGRIARAAGALDGHTVVEVGPGPGGLTRALLAAGARRVVAIELDQRCHAALGELAACFPGRLEVIQGDAFDVDPATLGPPPLKIVANLPYNAATRLLVGWLPTIAAFESLTLMFQKEVAERLTASPRGKDYGRVTVLVQWLAAARRLFDVSPAAFVPPPKVTSSVIHLTPRPEPLAPADFEALSRVTRAAFGQRRKMLRQSLKALGTDPLPLLEQAGIRPEARAEELDVAAFAALARAWRAQSP